MSNPADIQPKPRQFLPAISLQIPQWAQTLLHQIKVNLEGVVLDPDLPGVPASLVGSQVRLGTLLTWDNIPKAVGFRVWRNTTNNFDTAVLVQEIHGLANTRYFDGSVPSSATYYYWIQGVNSKWQAGPVSALVSVVIS